MKRNTFNFELVNLRHVPQHIVTWLYTPIYLTVNIIQKTDADISKLKEIQTAYPVVTLSITSP